MTVAGPAGASPLDAGDEPSAEVVQLIELLFFAYRDFTGDADAILAEYGYGRAHHRVLHFITRYPGLRVADLLLILNITKQSLARVLRQLVESGLVVQSAGDTDRRERRLHVTPAGRAFMKRMTPLVASHEAEIASGLRPDERDRLIELLEKVFSTVAALER